MHTTELTDCATCWSNTSTAKLLETPSLDTSSPSTTSGTAFSVVSSPVRVESSIHLTQLNSWICQNSSHHLNHLFTQLCLCGPVSMWRITKWRLPCNRMSPPLVDETLPRNFLAEGRPNATPFPLFYPKSGEFHEFFQYKIARDLTWWHGGWWIVRLLLVHPWSPSAHIDCPRRFRRHLSIVRPSSTFSWLLLWCR